MEIIEILFCQNSCLLWIREQNHMLPIQIRSNSDDKILILERSAAKVIEGKAKLGLGFYLFTEELTLAF